MTPPTVTTLSRHLAVISPDVDWRRLAACEGADPRAVIFFPEKGGTSEAALKICRRCPVAAECLEEELAIERADGTRGVWGVYGGMTARERQRLLRTEKRRASR